MRLLEIRNLHVHVRAPGGKVARAVDGVELRVEEGEALGIVGESGSGKTLLALSILGLQPGGKESLLEGSSVRYRGRELVGMAEAELRRIRGGEIAMVFQEPMTSLNPVFTVGNQIRESLRLHRGIGGGEAREAAVDLLREVGIPRPEAMVRVFPHQLSGGMRQRVMIAMALAGKPALLVADEPTTALDVTIQLQILELLRGLQESRGMGLLLVSHDLSVVGRVCQRVVVMYGGKVVETGRAGDVLAKPRHPYTRGLLGSRLSLRDRRRTLRPIEGEVPEATDWPDGCRFHPRCPEAEERCSAEMPPLVGDALCWLPTSGEGGGAS